MSVRNLSFAKMENPTQNGLSERVFTGSQNQKILTAVPIPGLVGPISASLVHTRRWRWWEGSRITQHPLPAPFPVSSRHCLCLGFLPIPQPFI